MRQADIETGAVGFHWGEFQPAVVFLGQFLADGEAKPGAVEFVVGEEGFEKLVYHAVRDAWSAVCHADL